MRQGTWEAFQGFVVLEKQFLNALEFGDRSWQLFQVVALTDGQFLQTQQPAHRRR